MTIDSRLRNIQKSLKSRELFLLWLKTSQARGGYVEYCERGEFQSWVSEHEDSALLYYLVVVVNDAVLTGTDHWRARAGWAGLLGISMIDASPESRPGECETARDFSERWREKLRTLLADIIALEQAVDLISEGYFDGHDVLFADTKELLTSCCEIAETLVAGHNCFAKENGKEPIEFNSDSGSPTHSVQQRLDEWVMLGRSKALMACGRMLEARDVLLSYLNSARLSISG